ncbi:MAG: long-chain fatty acid--CoA ligase [Bacillota bacterium]
MMNIPLNLSTLLERAEKLFPKKLVISRTLSKTHRLTYKEIGERTRRLSSALEKLGIEFGDKVATLAWNQHRHLEAYFAVPGLGAVLHMVNIRLSPEHLIYIINHAENKAVLFDEDLLPLVERIADKLTTVKHFIIMSDQEELPETTISPLYSYEKLLESGDPQFQFKRDFDENTPAGMCFTSATTGNPKGVVYTHRALVLHSFALGLVDTLALSERDVSMPVVPMFHVNAWGMPYAGTWFGTTQVLPGPQFTPTILADLIEQEKVTVTAGVPTIWMGLLNEIEKGNRDMSSLRVIVCGGSAPPPAMIKAYEQKHGIPFINAYGMTETTPVATVSLLKSYQLNLPYEEQLVFKAKQGLLTPGLEMRIVSDKGDVKWDGQEMGELLLRGPWIASEYYKEEGSEHIFADGWLHTGDIATVDEEGFVKLVDRTKDLIKSGGEWISSQDLENALMGHEAVAEAAVVAVPSEKWDERPVACVVLRESYKGKTTEQELIDYLAPKFAKWWLPDAVLFLEEIPKTSVGKMLKRALREQIKGMVNIK